MPIHRTLYAQIMILLSLWWGTTVMIDFLVIPTVFRTIDNFFLAGELGIAVFTKFNGIELLLSTLLMALIVLLYLKNKKTKFLFVFSSALLSLSQFYFWFLTPKLRDLTQLWRENELTGRLGANGIPDVQQAHQFYHQLYVGLDSFKLITIAIMLVLMVLKEEDWR